MKPPFVLVPDVLSNDTIECLEQLLEQAKLGAIIGIAFAAVLKKRGFIVNTAGEAHRNSVFARGMIACLDDQLSTKVRGGNS